MENMKLLIVEDDPLFGVALVTALEEADYKVRLAVCGAAALEAASEESFDMVLQDIKLPDADGLDILSELLLRQPHCKSLVMTGHATVDRAIDAMKIGACDFLTKPFPPDLLFVKLEKALKIREIEFELATLKKQISVKGSVITRSPAMKKIMEMAQCVALTDTTVLLQGESGTGKEMLADAVHQLSRRAAKPCIKVNCAAIPEHLVESELFGVERGAFTGADRSRPGYLERAAEGTLFLDEIGDMPLLLQGKLLRALEEKIVYRVGGTEGRRVAFRLIAATNRDLKSMVAQHSFREDLYFRLNVVPITLPPLRERREDIPLLIAHFQEQLPATRRLILSAEAIETLCRYDYPGNIRELKNILEKLSIFHSGETIRAHHIPHSFNSDSVLGNLFESFPVGKQLKDAVSEFEQRYIEKVLKSTSGSKSRAADILGLSRKVLWEKLKRNGES